MEIPRENKTSRFESLFGEVGTKIKSVFKKILP
jgi:NAD+--asparagine ADP-ribosyltransferase